MGAKTSRRNGARSNLSAKAPPPKRQGAGKIGRASITIRLAAAGPDEGVALAVLVVEEVGVDRSVEARIVELDREIVAALAGALRPGGADLGATDVDPVAGSVVAGPVVSGTMRTPLAWTLRVTISPWNSLAGLLECADGSHVSSPCCFRARDHRGLDGDLRAGGDRRRIACDRSKAEDGGGETFLPREEWASPGEESRSAAVAAQAVEAQPAFGQIKPMRGRGARVRRTAFRRCGSERAVHTRSRAFQAKKRETWRAERRPSPDRSGQTSAHGPETIWLASAEEIVLSAEANQRTAMSRDEQRRKDIKTTW